MQEEEYHPPSKREWVNYENYNDYLKNITNKVQSMDCIVCGKFVHAQSLYLDRHKKCHNHMLSNLKRSPRKCVICGAAPGIHAFPFCDKHNLDGFHALFQRNFRNLYDSINVWLPKTDVKTHASGYVTPDGIFHEMGELYHSDVTDNILFSIGMNVMKHSTREPIEQFLKITGAVRISYINSNGSHSTAFEYYDLNNMQKNIIYDIHMGLRSHEYTTLDGHGHPSEKKLNHYMSSMTNHV